MKNLSPSLILYFVSYILYLFFFKIMEDKETILYVKPIILASISFYYVNQPYLKKNNLHYFIIGLTFIADNMNLFGEVLFHEVSIVFYIVVLFTLLFLIVKDSKLLENKRILNRYFGVLIVVLVVLFVFSKLTSIYNFKTKMHQYYLILNYIVVFLSVLILSIYNFIKWKNLSSKFLVATLSCLFLSDLFAVINSYYYTNRLLVYLSLISEIPVYYFLIKYFINRDLEEAK